MVLALAPDGKSAHLDGGLIQNFCEIENHQTVYAWGHSMLAQLYYDL